MPDETEFLVNFDDNLPEVIDRLDEFDDKVDAVYDSMEEFADLSVDEIVDSLSESQEITEQLSEASNMMAEQFAEGADMAGDMPDAVAEVQDTLEGVLDAQRQLNEAQAEGHWQASNEAYERLEANFEEFKGKYETALDDIDVKGDDIAQKFEDSGVEMGENISEGINPEELGEKTGSVLSDTFSKAAEGDLQGILMGGAQGIDSFIKDVTTGGDGGGGGAVGDAVTGSATEGAMDAATSGGGGGGLKGTMKSLGGKLKALGPALTAIGGVAAIGAVFAKGLEQAKGLNKELADTVSYAELGTTTLQETNYVMEQLRDAATDAGTNFRLGLKPEDHMQILGALQEEGGVLRDLRDEYGQWRNAALNTVQDIRVASINLGASNKEVASFVGEMMARHGRSFDEMQSNLDLMQQSAVDADMQAEDFFSTIQQMSSQLGLYNYNLEDSVDLLEGMSQVLNPEKAKEFTETMVGGVKEMGHEERIRLATLSDQADIRDRIKEAASENIKNLDKQSKISSIMANYTDQTVRNTEDMQSALQNMSNQERSEFIAEVRGSIGKETAKTLSKSSNLLEKSSGGIMDLSDAMASLGGTDNLALQTEMLESALGKDLSDMRSMVTKQFGVDQDQLRMMRRLKEISSGGYSALQRAVQSNNPKDAVRKVAEKFGIKARYDEERNALVDENGDRIEDQYDVLDNLRDDVKSQEETGLSTAEKQVKATQGIGRILETQIASLLNTVGDAALSIEQTLYSAPMFSPGGAAEKGKSKLQSEISGIRGSRLRLEQKLSQVEDKGTKERIKREIKDLKSKEQRKKKTMDMLERHGQLLRDRGNQESKIKAITGSSGVKGLREADRMRKKAGMGHMGLKRFLTEYESEQGPAGMRLKRRVRELQDLYREKQELGGLSEEQQKIYKDSKRKLAERFGEEKMKELKKGRGTMPKTEMQRQLEHLMSPMIPDRFEAASRVDLEAPKSQILNQMKRGRKREEEKRKRSVIGELQSMIWNGEDQKAVQETMKDKIAKLKRDGFDITKDTEEKFQSAVEKGFKKRALAKHIAEATGASTLEGYRAVASAQRGTLDKNLKGATGSQRAAYEKMKGLRSKQGAPIVGKTPSGGGTSEGAGESWTKSLNPFSSEDVRMVTGGIPLLDLQAGDVIVDQDELANTMTGKAGKYVPKAVKDATGGATGTRRGGGGQNVMHAHFNISGGNVQKLERKILKVIDMWERGK